ncbi:MAG: hypothetical protein ACR2K2_08555 [Mycobacteriales bacterium]
MVAVGFVLLVLSALLAVGMVLTNRESVQAEVFGVSLDNVSVGGLFLVGLVVGVVTMIGLGLMLAGAARRRAKRVAAKREVRNVRGERESLAEENARLQAELERTTTVAPAASTGKTADGDNVDGGAVHGRTGSTDAIPGSAGSGSAGSESAGSESAARVDGTAPVGTAPAGEGVTRTDNDLDTTGRHQA